MSIARRESLHGDRAEAQKAIDVEPWLKAAQRFKMNSDFELPGIASAPSQDLKTLMDIMKMESDGKQTIQTLADKIMLSRICDNLQIPHLPNLLAVWDDVYRDEVAELIDRGMVNNPDAEDIVVKPTHLSSGAGVCSITALQPDERDEVVDWLTQHMKDFMRTQAASHESLALQSLRPGFVAQPRYEASVRFKLPLELRVIALWGQVRMGIWWWGREGSDQSDNPHRSVWIVRQPARKDELSDEDEWKVIHDHPRFNPGFERAIEIFKRHMPTMVAYCETLATAVGAPFLRGDFFVGSPKWGVRLNEVAYGCGCDYRNRHPSDAVGSFDDAPAMARILQEGMALCKARYPAKEFLSNLGVRGDDYASMDIIALRPALNPSKLPQRLPDEDIIIPEDLCETPCHPAPATPPVSNKAIAAAVPELHGVKSLPLMALPSHAVRSKSVEPETRLFVKKHSPRCHSMSRRCTSFEHTAGLGGSLDFTRTSSSVKLTPSCHTPQRMLVARAVGSSAQAREVPKFRDSCRGFRSVARLGGC
jgi:hypothetical protein